MNKLFWLILPLAILPCLQMSVQTAVPAEPHPFIPVHSYDPARNAAKDLEDAQLEARRTGRRILIVVGGEWASWCHALDKFFEEHKDLSALLDKNFVLLEVNFSRENQNRQFLSRFPKIWEYPHLFVLAADGNLLDSQSTGPLEKGESYDPEKFRGFLEKWPHSDPAAR
jgi:hypothetical protein